MASAFEIRRLSSVAIEGKIRTPVGARIEQSPRILSLKESSFPCGAMLDLIFSAPSSPTVTFYIVWEDIMFELVGTRLTETSCNEFLKLSSSAAYTFKGW